LCMGRSQPNRGDGTIHFDSLSVVLL
jgi:hypothetical protein